MLQFDPHMIWMTLVFVLGYIFITIEDVTKVSKTTVALMMAILCWIIEYHHGSSASASQQSLNEHVASISQVVFFLLGALAIVEIINTHEGFSGLAEWIRMKSKKKLLWAIGFITFFLSSILDNLTTTIVMISILQSLIDNPEERRIIGGGIVIAANAGGAWTPIGDVTTTMLWIGGQVSTQSIMLDLFLPSIACMLVAFFFLQFMLKGDFEESKIHFLEKTTPPFSKAVFYLALASLVFVPIFKSTTGLPPFMGILLGMSILWIFTDLAHRNQNEFSYLRVHHILPKIDLSSTLFFLGILLCINALDTAGILKLSAKYLDSVVSNTDVIGIIIGLVSAVVDNVPLVAATMGMYDLTQYPPDHRLWQIIAYCAGTGGSILIIGSAAGVVYMGLEKVGFIWFLKRISFPALAGYFAGVFVYILMKGVL